MCGHIHHGEGERGGGLGWYLRGKGAIVVCMDTCTHFGSVVGIQGGGRGRLLISTHTHTLWV